MTSYNGTSYSWQGRELTKITNGSNTYSYKYDADGIRTSKTVNGTKTEFFLNGSQILAQKTGDTTILFFYDSTGKRVGFANGDTLYYYLYSVQGDVIAIMRAATGQVVAKYSYDAWGKCTVTNASGYTVGEKNPFRYRGYYYDTETGLYYLNSRYYSPEFGRFISADNQLSIGDDLTGLNLFAYCGNNPINRVDPTGEAWWHWALGAVIVAVCAVATVVTCGGFAAAATAVGLVSSGMAASSAAATISAGALIGSTVAYGTAAVTAASSSGSLREFNDQGNWGTVAATAGGAVVGGAGAYLGTKGSNTTPSTTKPKVTSTIKNDVIDLPRTGSALKTDPYHAFPNIVDNYAGYATKSPISNGALYQLQGSLNGTVGRFEWIIQNQQVTHRMFVPGGGINGIPIMP